MSKKYLIVMDFLYLKYEIEYKENMSPQEVIKKVQPYFFPCEQKNEYLSDKNEKSYNKFCLYRSDAPDFKGARFVTWKIKPHELDYQKYQFYIFRPFINVYLTIYVVTPEEKEKDQAKAHLNLIYPIKKKVKLLKNYLKDNLQILTKNKEAFKDLPITGFSLQFVSDSQELTDEQYIEQSMNGKEIFLIVNSENTISQNFYMPGRFYYIFYDPASKKLNRETQALDESRGFTLDDTKIKLVRKHLENNQLPKENVLITFNSVMLKNKFDKLDDLFCDNDFYKFIVIFEKSEVSINPIPETFQYEEERKYKIPIPANGRPNIIEFEVAGDPKRELTQIDEEESIDQPADETNETANDNNNEHETEINNSSILNELNNEQSSQENNEPYIEEEEEDLDDDEIKNDEDEEKLLDKFCYYFMNFQQEKKLFEKKTPNPSYFKNLSNEETNLLKTFKKYYHLYRELNQY